MPAFLLGFISPAQAGVAYIHFVGVHPDYRQCGLARQLYQHFFSVVSATSAREIKAITSPVNDKSMAFHRQLGYVVMPGDIIKDGVARHSNYAGAGQDHVLFLLELEPELKPDR